jgi:hypothetical protein
MEKMMKVVALLYLHDVLYDMTFALYKNDE